MLLALWLPTKVGQTIRNDQLYSSYPDRRSIVLYLEAVWTSLTVVNVLRFGFLGSFICLDTQDLEIVRRATPADKTFGRAFFRSIRYVVPVSSKWISYPLLVLYLCMAHDFLFFCFFVPRSSRRTIEEGGQCTATTRTGSGSGGWFT